MASLIMSQCLSSSMLLMLIASDGLPHQEPMPLENSSNMLLMLLALVQRSGAVLARQWLAPYLPLLTTWTEVLIGLKGILAIRAFAELCTIMQLDDESRQFNGGRAPPQHGGRAPPQHGGRAQDGARTGRPCAEYASIAADYASTWQLYAFNATGQPPHYSMSFNVDEYQDSWSLKYNLLWQRLLRLDGPFDYDAIAALETAYYLEQANEFGTPLDPRHQYTKADWLSWVAAMSPDEARWHALFSPIFEVLNTTSSRAPFTDLYDTISGELAINGAFIARPVVGALFAKLLL
ncbi:glutaminase a [Chrysochromulina tobinii]|uniref:Glutaminase a n=1 Tax=Chrysochromulina tobinii TaxID=1460289 RepID=A0A0M0JCI0_9EUKA|nr:glutaminase a [Chrysochromulina tobinii]|eukprot:KOO24284.1 glutaminase a [Chrysochromulina sp. CCMP291]